MVNFFQAAILLVGLAVMGYFVVTLVYDQSTNNPVSNASTSYGAYKTNNDIGGLTAKFLPEAIMGLAAVVIFIAISRFTGNSGE